MKIIVAPDSFKGSISQFEFVNIAYDAIKEVNKNIEVIKMPLSDGGEGVLDVIHYIKGGTFKEYDTFDAQMRPIKAKVLFIDNIAYIESAKVVGLTLVLDKLDILNATSYGLGYLLNQIVDEVEEINIFLGGSATNDAGMGMMEFNEKIKKCKYNIYSDVTNPLLGCLGATNVFSKQKGASPSDMIILENRLKEFSYDKKEYRDTPGAGAAGGLGFYFISYLGAKISSGIKYVLDLYDIKNIDFDYIFTGEGKFDSQSYNGKVISELFNLGKDVFVFCGLNESNYKYAYQISEKIDFDNTIINLKNKIKEVLLNEILKK